MALDTLNTSYCDNIIYNPLNIFYNFFDKSSCRNVGIFDYVFGGCDKVGCELSMRRRCYESVSDAIKLINQPIFNQAISNVNHTYCENIINVKPFCEGGCYVSPLYDDACLDQNTEQEKCYLALAYLTNDSTVCSKIVRGRVGCNSSFVCRPVIAQEECLTYMARVYNNPVLCDDIIPSLNRNWCIDAV